MKGRFQKGLVPANKGKGRGYAFILAHIDYQGEGCLTYPLKGRDGQGRATVGVNGKIWLAHRLMCILAYGEPPTPRHQAAHTCGKGHEGCINPRHLKWKTNGENQRDRAEHGTRLIPDNPYGQHGKLTEAQVAEIKELRGKMLVRDIAAKFGVCTGTINYWNRYFDGGRGKDNLTFPNSAPLL